jgi:hypothetical protein
MKQFGVDFKADAEIDKSNLQDECVVQPSLYGYYAMQLAEARNELDVAKSNLDATIARRSAHYYKAPADGIKPTAEGMKTMVGNDTEVQEAYKEVDKKQAIVNTLYASVSTLEQRKGMLDNLVKLSLARYYNESESDNSGRDRLNDSMNRQ